MKEIETIYSCLEFGKYEIERIPEDYIVRKLFTHEEYEVLQKHLEGLRKPQE